MSPISFNQIPTNWREPGWLAEVDNTGANTGASGGNRTIIIGQRLPTGLVAAEATSALMRSEQQVKDAFGKGSMLHRQIRGFLYGNKTSELYAIAVDDLPAGVRATGSIAITGPATGSGTLHLYLGASLPAGHRAVGITNEDTAAEIATAIKEAINDYGDELNSGHLTAGVWYEITARAEVTFTTDGAPNNLVGTIFQATGSSITLTATDKVKPISNDLAVFAAVAIATPTVVDITAKHKGTLGNGIDIRANYYGELGGEKTPSGVALSITAMAHGDGDPDIANVIAALGSTKYFAVINPFADPSNLNKLATEMDDRWGPMEQLYGHAWSSKKETVSNLGTFGNSRNDPANTVFGNDKSPTPIEEILAACTAVAVASLEIDPARPLHTLPVRYVLPPAVDDRFDKMENNTLLYDGISPLNVGSDGFVQLSKVITTYQVNPSGDPDNSYLDVTTRYTIQAFNEFNRAWVMSKYPRVKVVPDGTPIPQGHAAVTPKDLKGALAAAYDKLQKLLIVCNLKVYVDRLVVEIDTLNPRRVCIEANPILVNGLDTIAFKNKFYLVFDEAA
jgi:phage tail sheath gpL-like